MTAVEMQYNFELKMGAFHSIVKFYTSTDIAVFLNRAQDDIVDIKYSNKLMSSDTYFEADEKIRTELGSLIQNHIVATGAFSTGPALHNNAVFANLPANYLYSLKEECTINYTDCNGNTGAQKDARVLPIRHEEYTMNINNPFGKPFEELVWRMDYGATATKVHELIHGIEQSIQTYRLRYLKMPVRIDIINGVNCELHESIHEEVVDRAIQLAMASLPQTKVEQN